MVTGTAVCQSTDQPRVTRLVPKATRTDSRRLRSRSCSSWEISIEEAMSSSVAAAPSRRPVCTLAYWRSRSVEARVATRMPGSIRAAVFRTYSATSSTPSSTLICAMVWALGRVRGSMAPTVAMMPECSRPIGSRLVVTVAASMRQGPPHGLRLRVPAECGVELDLLALARRLVDPVAQLLVAAGVDDEAVALLAGADLGELLQGGAVADGQGGGGRDLVLPERPRLDHVGLDRADDALHPLCGPELLDGPGGGVPGDLLREGVELGARGVLARHRLELVADRREEHLEGHRVGRRRR